MAIDRAYAFIELSALEAPLADIGYRVVVDDPTATLRIERPAIGSSTVMRVGLKPSPAEEIRLVFCDATYADRPSDGVDDVEMSLQILNHHLPFGRIEQDTDGSIHARWTIPTHATEALDDELTITSIVMFDLVQQHFGDYIEEICAGNVPASTLESLMEQAGDTE